MGAIGGLLGLNGGVNGTGIGGPSGVPITPGANAGQLQTAYGGAQNSLASQQALLQALQAQGGLQNQNQVYGQLQGIANGTGPNPAQAMLNNATGQNIASQAALMAGQRGASANAGLLARQAGMQGAGIQQNAVGQGAALQANQALNAIGAAGNMANTQAGQLMQGTTANTQANQSEQQILQNANSQANNANVAMQGNINNANAGLVNTTMQGQQAMIGGVMQGGGAALGMADGGMVRGYADGGSVSGPQSSAGQFLSGWSGQNAATPNSIDMGTPGGWNNYGAAALQKGMSAFGQGIGKAMQGSPSTPMTDAGLTMPEMGSQFAGSAPTLGVLPSAAAAAPSLGMEAALLSRGGRVPTLLSPGERYLPPREAKEVASGKKSPMKAGQTVPGKAKVKGDSETNDTVPAMLEPGGVVVKRSVMNSKDAENKAAKFVQAVLAKKGRK